MSLLVVNCRRLPFSSTLGVSHALLQLCKSLASGHDLTFVVDNLNDIDESPAREEVRAVATRISTTAEAKADDKLTYRAIELLPHHFQESELCSRSIVACYDLHVFDIPWKYGDRADSLQRSFRRILSNARAVMTPFPRTYYAVERVAQISLMNLFLTESPLLLDTSSVLTVPKTRAAAESRTHRLLYPAQLQLHKNHEALIPAVKNLRQRGTDVIIVCPGSHHSAKATSRLQSLFEASGVGEAFEFLGRISDDALLELYRTCDGLVVPSLAEGGAYVALEAIAAGKPVAVNKIEAATAHVNALRGEVIWFDASDPSGTSRAIETLVDADPSEWFERNEECRARLSSATWDGVAEKWNMVIEMIEGHRDRPVLRMDSLASEVTYA